MAIALIDSAQKEERPISFIPVQESRIPSETANSSHAIEGATPAHTKLVSAVPSSPKVIPLEAPKADRSLATNSVAAAKGLGTNQQNVAYPVQGLSGVNGPIDEPENWKIFEVPEPRTPPFPVLHEWNKKFGKYGWHPLAVFISIIVLPFYVLGDLLTSPLWIYRLLVQD